MRGKGFGAGRGGRGRGSRSAGVLAPRPASVRQGRGVTPCGTDRTDGTSQRSSYLGESTVIGRWAFLSFDRKCVSLYGVTYCAGGHAFPSSSPQHPLSGHLQSGDEC